MTLTMIIAIIAAMLFGVFCVLCLYSLFKNQKDIEKNENRMKNIESKLGNMTDLINSRTDMLENKINEQPIYNVYSDMIDINPSYPYDTPAEGTEGAINISDFLNGDFEDILVDDTDNSEYYSGKDSLEDDEVLSAFMDSFKAFEKEVLGGDIIQSESPKFIREEQEFISEEPKVIEEEQKNNSFKHHEGHDVGKSGKKYSVSELEKLIRE